MELYLKCDKYWIDFVLFLVIRYSEISLWNKNDPGESHRELLSVEQRSLSVRSNN